MGCLGGSLVWALVEAGLFEREVVFGGFAGFGFGADSGCWKVRIGNFGPTPHL